MKTIQIKQIRFYNWSGINGSFDMNPGQNRFVGKNGAGKTRLASAEPWVLWGKNLEGNTKDEVKTLEAGKLQSKADHAVFIEYEIFTPTGNRHMNVDIFKVGRLLREKWKKPRGQVEEVRDGNDIFYYMNGMSPDEAEKITAKQFQALINEKLGPNYEKCSRLDFVSKMPWKERRDMLCSMAPVDSEKIIDSIPGFKEALAGKTPDQRKEFADKRAKELKEKFSANESARKEREKDVSDVGSMTEIEAIRAITDISGEVAACQRKIDLLKQGDNSETLKRIQDLNQELTRVQNDFEEKKQAAIAANNERIRNIKGLESEIEQLKGSLDAEQEKRAALLAEYREEFSKSAETISEICESCGQTLPEDILNRLKENFNRDRSERLAKNKGKGLAVKGEIDKLESLIVQSQNRLAELQEQKPDPLVFMLCERHDPVIALKRQIADLKPKPTESSPELSRLQTELEALNIRLENARNQKAKVVAVEESRKRLLELEEERKKLSSENDKIQNFLTAYDKYQQAYADAMQVPVNAMFRIARFRMFDVQETGKQIPACIVCNQDWKEYDSMLSTGEKMAVDLDSVRVMQEYFKTASPVWIDERQSYTGKIDLNCQYFELVTREDVEQLTKEV